MLIIMLVFVFIFIFVFYQSLIDMWLIKDFIVEIDFSFNFRIDLFWFIIGGLIFGDLVI